MPSYTKQTWQDNNASYPGSAARFSHMEDGIALAVSTSQTARPWFGLNSNSISGYGAINMWSNAGFSWDRLDLKQPAAVSTLLTKIQTALDNGMTDIVVNVELPTYATASAFPTDAPTQASYASYFVSTIEAVEAAHPGVCLFEITNEPWEPAFWSSPATAAQYAQLTLTVLQACQSAGLDLTRIYPMVKDQSWPAAMIAAQSGLTSLIKGWAIHPYGAPPVNGSSIPATSQGIAAAPYFRMQLLTNGYPGVNNILISELGISDYTIGSFGRTSDQGALTDYQTQQWVWWVLKFAERMNAAGWLKALIWYSRNDAAWAANAAGGALTAGVGQALAQWPMEPDSDVVLELNVDGWLGRTGDPWLFRDSVLLQTSGKVHLWRIRVPKRGFANRLTFYNAVAGAGLTAARTIAGVYDNLGNLLDSGVQSDTAVDLATKFAAAGKIEVALAGYQYKPGIYYAALGSNWTTTAPSPRGVSNADQGWTGNGSGLPTRQMLSVETFTTALPTTIAFASASRLSFGAFAALHG